MQWDGLPEKYYRKISETSIHTLHWEERPREAWALSGCVGDRDKDRRQGTVVETGNKDEQTRARLTTNRKVKVKKKGIKAEDKVFKLEQLAISLAKRGFRERNKFSSAS